MLRTLLVEDSRDIRPRMVRCLSDLDDVSVVATSETIAEAGDLIRELQPDFLVLDLSLPDGNSADHIRHFKSLATHMEVAIHSNDASAHMRQKCLNEGASWFFDKSGELEDLLALVQERARLAKMR
jgi:DNA-binding NarL/FixJ family response regulator